jgi:RHS repeat-associated protein
MLDTIPRYLFNAKEKDEESGMYYYEARYYAPPTFISRDPLFEERHWLNPYHYCSNNPVNRIDPTGLSDWEPDGNGGWVAEKGDNAWTLHKDANISYDKAKSLMKEQGFEFSNDDKHVKVQIGDKVQVENTSTTTSQNGTTNPPSGTTPTQTTSTANTIPIPVAVGLGQVVGEVLTGTAMTIVKAIPILLGGGILLQGDTRPGQRDEMSQHGTNDNRLGAQEVAKLRAKQQAGTLTNAEKQKLNTHEKATGAKHSRHSKDKKK